MNFFLGIRVLDFLLTIIKPIRRYHFDYFPNFHFIGVVLIFILTKARIAQAKNGYFTQSLPAFQRKVYHPKGVVEADINLVNFFGS